MPKYKYLAADTLTGKILAELPLSGVGYNIAVNDAATFSATCPLDSAVDLIDATNPLKTSIYIDRGGQIQWAGILWGRRYSASSRSIQLDGSDWLSYLDRVVIAATQTYTAVDQLSLARSLINYGFAKNGLSVVYRGTVTSSVPRTFKYLIGDYAPAGQRLREAASMEGGFDFQFGAEYIGGAIRRNVQLGYPQLGRPYHADTGVLDSGVIFEDADCTEITWDEDASSSASVIYGTGGVPDGSPSGTAPPIATSTAADVAAAGYPKLEAAGTWSTQWSTAAVQAHADGRRDRIKFPLQTMTLQISSGSRGAPALGTYVPGDHVILKIRRGDPRFRFGARIVAVVTSISVAVDDEHNDMVTVGLAPFTTIPGERLADA